MKFNDGEMVKVARGKYKGNRAKYVERVLDYGYVTPNAYMEIYVDGEWKMHTTLPIKSLKKFGS